MVGFRVIQVKRSWLHARDVVFFGNHGNLPNPDMFFLTAMLDVP